MIVSFSCVFRNLKKTYQASNLSDEFEKKRKCNAYRKEKRELPLFLSLYLCLCFWRFLSYTYPDTHLLYSFLPVDSGTLVGPLLGDENFLEGLKAVGGLDSMVQCKESWAWKHRTWVSFYLHHEPPVSIQASHVFGAQRSVVKDCLTAMNS